MGRYFYPPVGMQHHEIIHIIQHSTSKNRLIYSTLQYSHTFIAVPRSATQFTECNSQTKYSTMTKFTSFVRLNSHFLTLPSASTSMLDAMHAESSENPIQNFQNIPHCKKQKQIIIVSQTRARACPNKQFSCVELARLKQ